MANDVAKELATLQWMGVAALREKYAAVLPLVRGGTRTGVFLTEKQDDRLPPDTILTRKYKGDTVQVKVLAQNFEYASERYGSLPRWRRR
jgi:hypothetical protein